MTHVLLMQIVHLLWMNSKWIGFWELLTWINWELFFFIVLNKQSQCWFNLISYADYSIEQFYK